MTISKDQIDWRDGHAAINIKTPYRTIEASVRKANREDPLPDGMTAEWVEANISDDRYQTIWEMICESELEYFTDWAAEIMPGVTFYQAGRSGGWAVSDYGPDEVNGWDAVMLAKWGKIERVAREIADNVPEQVLYSIAINEWEQAEELAAERGRASAVAVA